MDLARILSDMLANGAGLDAVKAVVEAAKRDSEAQAVTRREQTAARVRRHRERAKSPVTHVTRYPSPSLSPSPEPPTTHPPTPVVITQCPSDTAPRGRTRRRTASRRDSEPEGFAAWWEAFPNKIGRGAAMPAYAKAIRSGRVTPEQLITGLRRYVTTKPPDRPWCNPATWLNQARWADEPAEPPLPLGSALSRRGFEPARRSAVSSRMDNANLIQARLRESRPRDPPPE